MTYLEINSFVAEQIKFFDGIQYPTTDQPEVVPYDRELDKILSNILNNFKKKNDITELNQDLHSLFEKITNKKLHPNCWQMTLLLNLKNAANIKEVLPEDLSAVIDGLDNFIEAQATYSQWLRKNAKINEVNVGVSDAVPFGSTVFILGTSHVGFYTSDNKILSHWIGSEDVTGFRELTIETAVNYLLSDYHLICSCLGSLREYYIATENKDKDNEVSSYLEQLLDKHPLDETAELTVAELQDIQQHIKANFAVVSVYKPIAAYNLNQYKKNIPDVSEIEFKKSNITKDNNNNVQHYYHKMSMFNNAKPRVSDEGALIGKSQKEQHIFYDGTKPATKFSPRKHAIEQEITSFLNKNTSITCVATKKDNNTTIYKLNNSNMQIVIRYAQGKMSVSGNNTKSQEINVLKKTNIAAIMQPLLKDIKNVTVQKESSDSKKVLDSKQIQSAAMAIK